MKPESEQELAEAVGAATGPLRIKGGGTRAIGAPVAGDVLETGGLSGITLYEPGALTLVAQAGTPLAEIEAALAAERQRLAFEPMDHRRLLRTTGESTIGGVIAGNVSGPRRIQCGAARDFLLGVRFVDGMGTVIKNGGRVMKNVTGYDLVKLMAGSWGTLGVLTEVSLKTQPLPETKACVLINGLSEKDAVRAMSAALGSPYDVTGAAHAPKGVDGHPVTMIRVEGFEGSVAYRADQLCKMFGSYDVAVETSPERVTSGWAWVRDVEALQDVDGDIWRLSVKPSDAPEIVATLSPKASLYDWGGGLIWIAMPEGINLRARLGAFAGHATLVRASDATRERIPAFQPEAAPVAALTKGIRDRFDPRSILNTGILS